MLGLSYGYCSVTGRLASQVLSATKATLISTRIMPIDKIRLSAMVPTNTAPSSKTSVMTQDPMKIVSLIAHQMLHHDETYPISYQVDKNPTEGAGKCDDYYI